MALLSPQTSTVNNSTVGDGGTILSMQECWLAKQPFYNVEKIQF